MIQLSAAATAEILRLKARRQPADVLFRLSVVRQGCMEFSYAMQFVTGPQAGDRTLDCNGIPIVLPETDLPYLENLRLDYSEDMMGGGFRFNNPIASQTCSCGNSFAIAP